MFNEYSIVVKAWVKRINGGENTREQVPALGNLQEVVFCVLDK